MTHPTTSNTHTKDHLSELSASKPNRKRLSLLWRTVLLLAISVLVCLGLLYAWIQHSVNAHFEQMDSEILDHARLVLEQQSLLTDGELALTQAQLNPLNPHRHALGLGYDLSILSFDAKGKFIGDLSQTSLPQTDLLTSLDLPALWQTHGERQFELITHQHHYRASILPIQQSASAPDISQPNNAQSSFAQANAKHQGYVLLALPIDVHHHYLAEFNRQLQVLLIGMALLLLSVTAISIYVGFAPLATFVQKMAGIRTDTLNDRIMVDAMPSELKPLAVSYNAMLDTLKQQFEALSRYSDHIAHELRTPLATLSTQTQVMLSQPRQPDEYIEQLHQQHQTLEQLSLLINNLLLLAKTQRKLTADQLIHIDTQAVLDNVLSYYEFVAEDRSIDFAIHTPLEAITGNKSLIQRLFANLVANAVYYAKANSTIVIDGMLSGSDTAPNRALSDVSNKRPKATANKPHQIGFCIGNQLANPLSQTEANRLFERFYRHHANQSLASHDIPMGSGLGLSIVQAIVHAHDGRVSIHVQEDWFEVRVVFAKHHKTQ